jgi:hypothetical protein
MKLTKLASIAMVAAVALAYNAKAIEVLFPPVKLTVSGTVSYNAASPADNGKTTKSALTKVSITTKSLISLLTNSPTVISTLMDVTGTNQIPAGSYFVYDLNTNNVLYDPNFGTPGEEGEEVMALIVTNKNGFSFTLAGYDSVAAANYDYGFLNIDQVNLIGSYSQNDTTGAGSESDLTGIEFYFNDGNGNQLDDYGNGVMTWSFGKVSTNSVQKTTLSVNFPAPNGCNDIVNYNAAIAQNVKCSGKATGNVVSVVFPFYLWWLELDIFGY